VLPSGAIRPIGIVVGEDKVSFHLEGEIEKGRLSLRLINELIEMVDRQRRTEDGKKRNILVRVARR
jgi:hypothetical protein